MSSGRCNRMQAGPVCNPDMDCRHQGELAVRWDYLNEEEACGTGWIVCRECLGLLDRFSLAGGGLPGDGRYPAAFQKQLLLRYTFLPLPGLEIDHRPFPPE